MARLSMAHSLRFHGSRDRATWDYVGYTSWLDKAQVAFLRVMLPKQVAPTGARGAPGHYEAA